MEETERYTRQVALFGAEGQTSIRASRIAIVGLGGLGSHIAQQAAYLGTRQFVLVDDDHVSLSNLNRLIGGLPGDVEAGALKVAVAERQILAIAPNADVRRVEDALTRETARALDGSQVIFGCLDHDLPRLVLTEYSAAHATPYVDLATDVAEDGTWYGGRVLFMTGDRCMHCLNELDQEMINRAAMTPEVREATDRIYGVDRQALDETGPSVVNLNGVVASLAMTEFMAWVTGLRDPWPHLKYAGERGIVTRPQPPDRPEGGCYYCDAVWPQAASDASDR